MNIKKKLYYVRVEQLENGFLLIESFGELHANNWDKALNYQGEKRYYCENLEEVHHKTAHIFSNY